ncbi:pancreatic triacylglycerol lipase-like isoform X1 [Daphnia pulicaria]|uniref:pancreatic triacylglycerol lipase-like isoform X1 n=2 Tax=Daphnia pulicaria TaxID=35523 RepID=UPI001EEBB4B4|nr:pancreatic triacylglycerol lipase-like isoform X1 [Daphnia pulicaria]
MTKILFCFACVPLFIVLANASSKVETNSFGKQSSGLNVSANVVDTTPVCYGELGCLALNQSWYNSLHRPINLMPMTRNRINTHFTLFTREKPMQGLKISAKNTTEITAASFKASRPTKFYIHGYLADAYEDRITTLVARLLGNGDFNVIVVHWGAGAYTTYGQAVANTRLVGLEIAFLVNTVIAKLGVKASDVHLIGHSLGSHIAGYAGEKILNLGRISGLDPAGPSFRSMPPFVRLDPSDAQFVEAIHTDGGALGFGLSEPVGHLDFYPNGGEVQPGCEPYPANFVASISALAAANTTLTDIVACDHMRVIYLYSDSFLSRNNCQTVAYECSDYDSFNKGACISCGSDNTKCVPFGLQASSYPSRSRRNVKLFFNTGSNVPYCRMHYAVNVSLAKAQHAKITVNGKLGLTVGGDKGAVSNVQLIQSNIGAKLEHGKNYQYLFSIGTNIGKTRKVNLRWDYVVNPLDPSTICGSLCNKKLYVNSVTISSLNNYPEINRIANTLKACPSSSPGIIGSESSSDFSVGGTCAK